MGLNVDQESWLADLLVAANENMKALSEWEQGFIADQQKRYDEYAADIRLSPKQIAVLERIKNKLDEARDG